MKRRVCAHCGKDLTKKNYAQVVVRGEIVKVCPSCANEVIKNEKNANDSNRMLSSRNIRVR